MMTCVDDVDSTVKERPDLHSVSAKMSESQRALELRKFFAPWSPETEEEDQTGYNESLDADGALYSYAENVVWRLQVERAMISLVDVDIQYFIAGALRDDHPPPTTEGVHKDTAWFGHNRSGVPGAIYEDNFINLTKKVMALERDGDDDCPCLVITNLADDPEYAKLPIVNGEITSHRFYAGAPITTNNNVPIGAFFVLCVDPRPAGLTQSQKQYLYKSAQNAMRHLETKREADERRRVSMMSQGMAEFLERTSRVTEHDLHFTETKNRKVTGRRRPKVGVGQHESSAKEDMTTDILKHEEDKAHDDPDRTIDKIKLTLEHAASILKESLDLNMGGVVFLDTALGYKHAGVADAYFDIESDLGAATVEQAQRIDGTKGEHEKDEETPTQQRETEQKYPLNSSRLSPRHVRGFDDHIKPAKVLAMCKAKTVQWETNAKIIDGMTLQSLLNTYPSGNVWYYDHTGYFSSLDQANEKAKEDSDVESDGKDDDEGGEVEHGPDPKKEEKSLKSLDAETGEGPKKTAELAVTQQQAEASLLLKVFEGARQVIFIPLWDAGNDRWHSGCFVWSKSAVPVFTVDSEIAYLSAFTNSVMIEISRLNAMTSNKMKADFISSISHEFRSPLHGILASAEFLRESPLENTQSEYVATIQNCGSTLLDTINHVLDFSKINSFAQKSSKGTISNELYEVSNVAILCEDIVNGMIAANQYTDAGVTRDHGDGILNDGVSKPQTQDNRHVYVILDIETRAWDFNIQPGAVRRVIMNIFGNAQKYTANGFILIQLRVDDNRKSNKFDRTVQQRESSQEPKRVLSLTIIDSGRGMSTEYMDRKLYQPFAQEDSFATGVGLGLSIVHSIVTQLGGKIEIRSECGKGTQVCVTIPLEHEEDQNHDLHDQTTSGTEARTAIDNAKKCVTGKTFTFLSHRQSSVDEYVVSKFWDCLRRYLVEWFGMVFVSSGDIHAAADADLVIMEQYDQDFSGLSAPFSSERNRLLVVRNHATTPQDYKFGKSQKAANNIWTPIGPHKLARSLLSLFTNQKPKFLQNSDRTFSQDSGTQTDLSLNLAMQRGASYTPDSTLTAPNSAPTLRPQPSVSRAISAMSGLVISDASDATPKTSGISTPPPEKSSPKTASTPPASSKDTPLRLLAVDDNDLNLQLLTRFLKKRKCDLITTARDGLEALNAVKSLSEGQGQNFDVIFMDITMPVMDGFDSTMNIRQYEIACRKGKLQNETLPQEDSFGSLDEVVNGETPDASKIPNIDLSSESSSSVVRRASGKAHIVALTGLASQRDRDRAVEAGVDDFMTKPVQFAKVGELLKRMCIQKGNE